MKKLFKFRIQGLHQERIVSDVYRIHLESLSGQRDVLYGHSPLFTVLKASQVEVYRHHFYGPRENYMVSGGVLLMKKGDVILMTQEFQESSS